MKKITFLFCALMVCLSASAVTELKVNQKMIKDDLTSQQILNGKMQKQVPSSKFVAGTKPIMKAPAAEMDNINVVANKYTVKFYSDDNDVYIQMTDVNGQYRFTFDIIVPAGQTELTPGQTYTLADMLSNYTSLYTENDGSMSFIANADAATFTLTVDNEGLEHIVATMTVGANIYNITYDEEPLPVATDTISIVIPSAQLGDYSTNGVFQFQGGNDDYYVYAAFNSNQIEGTYDHDDLYLQYTSIYDFANDTTRINVLSGDAVITFANDTFVMDAYYLGEDVHCYHVTLSCPLHNYNIFRVGKLNYEITSLNPIEVSIIGNIINNDTNLIIADSVYYYGKNYVITRIVDNAFNGCTGLKSIILTESITEIGHYAFYNTGLVSIVVPENIQSTGNRAFGYCTNLQSVVWNAINCTTYDDGQYVYPPFQESPNITSFTIGNGVQNIPNGLCFGTMITEIEIPNTVDTIGVAAFRECSALTTVNIPNSVTTIGGSAFYSCNNLNSITISENITRINSYTFYGCSSLTSLSIPENVQVIGYEAFANCGNLSTILIPQNVSYLADDAFSGCNNLTSVMWNAQNCAVGNLNNYNYDESVNRIYYWRDATSSPFPSSVQTFIFGNQVERIPNYLCYGLSSLSSINISESVSEIGRYAFAECTGLDSVVIPLNVDTMGDYAFNNCTNLTSVVWNAKHCADFATYEGTPFASIYNHITSFIFGNQVERIPYGLCHWMHKLTSISIPNSVIEIGNSAFNSCQGLRSIILPESLKQIGYRAFRNCDGLQSITIPKNVEVVFNEVFMDCDSLRSVVWNASNRWCTTPLPDLTDVTFFPTTVERFTFGNGVQYIPHHLCNGMDKLTSVILPNSLKEIGVGAFQDCIGLTSILIPDSVSYICKDAFSGCNNLNFVIWNARSCQNIDYEVSSYDSINKFYYFQEIPNSSCPFSPTIQTFIFGDNVQLIPAGICREMNLLSSIALPNTVTEIGQYAFCDCSGLISFTMEEGVNAILSGGFAGCSNLLQITLPNSLTNIGEFAFDGCSNLTTITIGNRVDTIGKSAFEDCIRLMSIVLPTSINQIGESAFYNCSSMNKAIVRSTAELNPYCMLLLNPQIDTIIAPASIFDIDEQHRLDYVCTKRMKYVKANSGELTEDAFAVIRRSASTLETLDVAATTNTTLSDEAFSNMYNLTTLALPQNLERISYMAVAGCKMLPSISIPATVTEIGTSAFEHCRSLQTVTFNGNNLTTIGNWAFYNNHALQQLTIPAGVTTIGAGAFYGCTYLEDLAMPASLRNVGDNAFALCNHLTKMQVEADLPPMVAARTFFDVSRNIPVYVPDEAVNDYRNTAIWQEFFIRPISQAATGIETVRENDNNGELLPDGKFFQDGKLLIRRNGKTYDLTGSLID